MKVLKGFQNTSPHTYGEGNTVTLNGEVHNVLNIKEKDLNLEKIAISLSRQNRYSGYTNQPYSVAQHSYYMAMSFLLRGEIELAEYALFHDAEETLSTSDINRPFKNLIREIVEPILHKTSRLVLKNYGINDSPEFEQTINILDKNSAQFEMTTMMRTQLFTDYWSHKKAKKMWLEMYNTIQIHKIYKHISTFQSPSNDTFNPDFLIFNEMDCYRNDVSAFGMTMNLKQIQNKINAGIIQFVCKLNDNHVFGVEFDREHFNSFLINRTFTLMLDDGEVEYYVPIQKEEVAKNQNREIVLMENTIEGNPINLEDFDFVNSNYFFGTRSFSIADFHALLKSKTTIIRSNNFEDIKLILQ
jgi:hypothetical protein